MENLIDFVVSGILVDKFVTQLFNNYPLKDIFYIYIYLSIYLSINQKTFLKLLH